MKIYIVICLSCCVALTNAAALLEAIIEKPTAPTEESNLPFAASVHVWFLDLFLVCGGAIINEKWILTAAHCYMGQLIPYYTIVGTDHYLNKNDAKRVSIKVQHFYIHPKYPITKVIFTGIEAPNDIGLLKLSKSLVFNANVQPIALPDNKDDNLNVGEKVYFAGFGMPQWWIPYPSGKLQISEYIIIPDKGTICLRDNDHTWMDSSDCRDKFTDTRLKFNLDDTMICVDYNRERSTCRGDSGSPLYKKTPKGYKLYGSDSWGLSPCYKENGPGVFTKLSKQLDWMSSTMSNNNKENSWFF